MTRSDAETLLALHLTEAGIPFEREVLFALPRKFRADFLIIGHPLLIEVEGGSYTGGHKRGKAYESDCDKHNLAMEKGLTVLRFTPAHVEDGRALAVIRQAVKEGWAA